MDDDHDLVFVGVLGGLQVTVGGVDIVIPRGVSARLLHVLAAEAGRVVRDATLIDRLWTDDRAPRSMGALRNAVMRLRSSLGDRAGVVERIGAGYRLGDSVRFDTLWFDEAVAEARAVHSVNPAVARRRVEGALSLVRGEPFADVAEEPWARRTVATWTDRIAEAEELLGDLVVAAGDRAAVEILSRHADERPEREVRWIQLMRLLDGVGRRAEAMRVYRRARAALAEFGIEPGRAIESLANGLVGPAAAPEQRAVVTQHSFVGRERLLVETRAALEASSPVSLVGIGGAGKTRLATEVQRSFEHDPQFGGTTIWVDLSAIDDVDLVELAFLSAAGLGSADRVPDVDPATMLATAIGNEPCIVVLDNAEHVRAGVAALASQLSGCGAQLKVLVTSRDRLEIDGERAIVVPPLPTPHEGASSEVCAANDAVQLLMHLLGGTGEPRTAARLVRAVGGLPLGIELVASMGRQVPLADLAMSLEQALPGVALDRPGYQPRQRLSAVFSHAIDNVAPTDRNALARLTGFTAPFTLLSAGRLAAAPLAGLDLDAPVVASLVRLAEAGLIQVQPGEPQRYALTPLQAAAASRLVAGSQSAAIRAAVEDWYVSFAREQGRRLRCPEQLDALHLIDAEFSNVLSVAHALLTAGRAREVLAITGGLGDYWRIGRNQLAGVQLLLAALEADSGGDSIERLQALVTLPFAASTFAGIARQAGRSRDATAMAVRLGRRDLADEALLAVGLAEAWAGRHLDGYETLGRVATSEANPWAAGTAQLIRSLMLIIVGRADDARRGVERVARELRIAGDRIGEATAFMHLAVGLQRHGEADDAEAAADRGLELAGGDIPLVTMHSKYVLGLIGDERGDRGGAELLEEVQRHFRHVGDLGCLNGVNRALADIARRRGDDDGALELLREVVWLLPDVDHQETAASLVQIAEVYLAQGHCDDAAILAMAAKRLVGGSGIGWNDRQHQRLAAVLDAAPVGPESPEHPLAHVIGVALQA